MQKHSNDFYLNGIKERSNSAVKEIYREFLPAVVAFVRKNSGQEEDARDIFNKVIYQFTARLEQEMIEIKINFEAYLFTACKNLWRRELLKIEKRRVTNEDVKELYYVEKDMVQATLEQERWELFRKKLSNVSENCRKILNMFLEKMSSKEIMVALDYGSEVTVRQRVFKCKAKLIESIKSDAKYNELKNS